MSAQSQPPAPAPVADKNGRGALGILGAVLIAASVVGIGSWEMSQARQAEMGQLRDDMAIADDLESINNQLRGGPALPVAGPRYQRPDPTPVYLLGGLAGLAGLIAVFMAIRR